MKHKNQHWIPQSYLSAWCDPDCPPEQEPYVWTFPKAGGDGKRKAPKNLFAESDMYTLKGPGGARGLHIEHGLGELEGNFVRVRRAIENRERLSVEDWVTLCVFIASMQARTASQRDHLSGFFNELVSLGKQMMAQWDASSPEERRVLASIEPVGSERESFSMDDVQMLAGETVQHTLGPMVQGQAEIFLQMRPRIICTDSNPGFITSDAPCSLCDPASRTVALGSPTVEVMLPLSPRQLVLLTWEPPERSLYFDIRPGRDEVADRLNGRTRFYCDKLFVVRRNVTRPMWFEGPSPAAEPAS